MKKTDHPLSRRRWLSAGTAAAALAPGLANAQSVNRPAAGARVYNIAEFGAKGDGQSLDTAAVQAAIDACHRDRGGTVLVPAGVFAIGTVEIKSNVTLHIAAGGKLLGAADGKQYYAAQAIPLHGDSTLEDGNVGLIFGVDAENVIVEGPGTIDGQGAQFRSPSRGVPPPSGRGGADRPYHLLFYRCPNLRVRDLSLVDCAFHSIRVIQCDHVWMEGIRIHNRVNGNNDGFHFISSRHVHVNNCDVASQDDACALFGSCRMVTVANSSFSTRWSVFRFGGGDPQDVTISNCVIYQTYGCPIKMHFGPESKVRNILFSNLVMHDVTGPIAIHLSDRGRGGAAVAAGQRGYLRDIGFHHIRANVVSEGRQFEDIAFTQNYRPGETRQAIVLNAIGDTFLENISFQDVHIAYGGGGTREEAAREIPQVAGEYFEIGTPPAYGLFARNVRGLDLHNVRLETETPDLRPAVTLDHVAGAAFNGLSVDGNPQAKSALRLAQSREVLVTAPRLLTPASVFLEVEGDASRDIVLEGGDISKAASPLAVEKGAAPDAVKIRG